MSNDMIGSVILEADAGEAVADTAARARTRGVRLFRHAGTLYELRDHWVSLGQLDVLPPEQSEFAVGDQVRPTFIAGNLRSQVGRVEHVDARNVWVRWPDGDRPSAHRPSQLEIVFWAHHKGEADEATDVP